MIKQVFESEETVWLCLQLKDGRELLMLLPTIPYMTVVEDEGKSESQIIFPVSIDDNEYFVEGTELLCAYFDMTNDPTPDRPCSLVSLGYYSLRTNFKGCKISCLNPLTLVGKKPEFPVEAIDIRYTRPQRRLGK